MRKSASEWLVFWGKGQLSVTEEPHLRHASIWQWARAESVPLPIASIADPIEQKRRMREYDDLWVFLFAQHVAGLPADDQQAVWERRHPSLSHTHSGEPHDVAEEFRSELTSRGIQVEVIVANKHDGRTVLDVPLSSWPLDGQWPDDLRACEINASVKPSDQVIPRVFWDQTWRLTIKFTSSEFLPRLRGAYLRGACRAWKRRGSVNMGGARIIEAREAGKWRSCVSNFS
jgi:hypothetical protein